MAIALMIGILSSGFISDRFGIKLCLVFGCAIQVYILKLFAG
jgi:MFS family permease